MSAVLDEDTFLVRRSVAGDRPAFAQIVARYQALVCSVAYSATGSISQSEDLAQETFLTAWRELRGLREPQRLKAWLCGIARNLAHNVLRRDGREPANDAEPIEAADAVPAAEAPPSEQAIQAEEQAILWRSIGRIPESYREPLILFYREHQSIERVAQSLELSEETVRQRLSRGRKLLQDEVVAFVEGALERSSPGKAFTLAVMAALPGYGVSSSASAAVLGSTVKGAGAIAKYTGLFAFLTATIGPMISAVSAYFSVRTALDAAPTERERALVKRQAFVLLGGSALFTAALWAFILPGAFWLAHPTAFVVLGLALPLGFAIWLTLGIIHSGRDSRRLRAEERARDPAGAAVFDRRFREYRSSATLLGLPLVHIRYGTPAVDAGPARGWIAIGDDAVGVLFAMGNTAVGGIALGAVAAGGLAIGGVAVGVVPMAAVAVGWLAIGGAAFGEFAVAGLAFGWEGAAGGLAAAREFAVGGFLALAPHANDAFAQAGVAAWLPGPTFLVILFALAVLVIVPTALLARHVRRLANSR